MVRRSTPDGDRIVKPRCVAWEQLMLDARSPLRRTLDQAPGLVGGLGEDAFEFLPDLAFFPSEGPDPVGGEVEALELDPLGELSAEESTELARVVGRSVALWSWLGVSDLHWENLALGRSEEGGLVFTPLDVEAIFDDLALPTETKLLPDADPEVAEICRHACGVRRVLPFLGKPIEQAHLVAMAADYLETLRCLDHHAEQIADAVSQVPDLHETPIRVCLRGTDVYVHAMLGSASEEEVWPPFLDAELEQMGRGDVPYFFRLFGEPGIHYYADPSLQTFDTLPTAGDVPRLEPLLDPSDGLRSPGRESLRTEGLFTLLGAFDHPKFRGSFEDGDLRVEFGDGVLVVETPEDELETDRDLSAFVGSVYLPCHCGEVHSVLVPDVTVCEPDVQESTDD